MRILVADDERVSLELVRHSLPEHHEVVMTSDGLAAWTAYQESWFELIISDWNMPKLDGVALCQKIRAQGAPRYTYFILVTGEEGKAKFLEAMQGGVDDFITKPFDRDQLRARINVAERILGLQKQVTQLDSVLDLYELRDAEDVLGTVVLKLHRLLTGHLPLPDGVQSRGSKDHAVAAEGYSILGFRVADDQLEVVKGSGQFEHTQNILQVDLKLLQKLYDALQARSIQTDGKRTFVPLRVGKKPLGVLYLEHSSPIDYNLQLLREFASGAAQALEMRRLFGLASQDDVTRAFLKNFFVKRAAGEVQTACRFDYPLTMAHVNVDGAEQFYEQFGETTGDQVLKSVCTVILGGLRAYDFVGRWDGPGFVIALPHTGADAGVDVIERLRRQVERMQLPLPFPEVHVTLSCGVATVEDFRVHDQKIILRPPLPANIVDKMMEQAGQLAAASQRLGGNRVTGGKGLGVSDLVADLA